MIKNKINKNTKINVKELPYKTIIKLIKENKAKLSDLERNNIIFKDKIAINEVINEAKKIIKMNVNNNNLSAFILNLHSIRIICNKAQENKMNKDALYYFFTSILFSSININRKCIIWFIISYAYLNSYMHGLQNQYEFDNNFNNFINDIIFFNLKINNDTISINEINKEINSEYGISINYDFAYEIACLNNKNNFLNNKINLYDSKEINNLYNKLKEIKHNE